MLAVSLSGLHLPISIHAPHARSDLAAARAGTPMLYFNPRSSCEERRKLRHRRDASKAISIHAPHARSDATTSCTAAAALNFNPRSSCEERRPSRENLTHDLERFQSTLLMRGATSSYIVAVRLQIDISIHAPHARSDTQDEPLYFEITTISIHAPHARSDMILPREGGKFGISIHAPHARSDLKDLLAEIGEEISIHAPHARSDIPQDKVSSDRLRISIHAPHARSDRLQSRRLPFLGISIHAPHARSDAHLEALVEHLFSHFNPRSSCEERLEERRLHRRGQ